MSRRSLQPLIALFAALVVVVLVAVTLAAPSDEGDPSSRSAGRLGTLALYTWLQKLGLPVSRVSGSFDLHNVDVLVVYDPTVAFSNDEVTALMAHVRGGGDAVVAVAPESAAAAAPLLQELGVSVLPGRDPGVATPAQPFDVAQRVQHVPTGGGLSLTPAPALVPLLVQQQQVVAASERVQGGGRVTVVAETQPLSNDGLRHDDSSFFLLSVLERARGGRIALDEFHHGEREGGGAGAIFSGPIGLAAVLAALIVVAFLALNGRRLGHPRGAAAPAPPSTETYVRAMAHLLARSRKRGSLAARYADELKRAVGGVTGVAAGLDDAEFVATLRGAQYPSAEDVARLLARARAMAAGDPDEASLHSLARDVDALERSVADVQPASAQLAL